MSESPGSGSEQVQLGWWLSSEEHDPRELVDHAIAAERIGVTTAMMSDHLQPWTRAQGQSAFVWSVLGAVAQATERLEIGTGVTAIMHRNSPINVAHAAATLAVMSNERFFLGVGTGERLNEQPFGDRWPRIPERRERLGEAIDLVRRLCAGEVVDHHGTHFTVERLDLKTRPAKAPPIYVASSGKASAKLAAEVGDGLIGVAPDARTVDVFRGSGGEGKRCLAQLHVSVAESLDEARDNAWKWWSVGAVPPSVLTELASPSDFEAIAEAVGPSALGDVVVCATGADPVVEAIDRFVGAGYTTVYLHQIGKDQERLRALIKSDLLPHYG